jgi:hypothetical protein
MVARARRGCTLLLPDDLCSSLFFAQLFCFFMPLHSFPVQLFDMGLELFWPRLKALEKFASGM